MSSHPLSFIDRPWLRFMLPAACSFGVFGLMLITLIGPSEAYQLWLVASLAQKLLLGVVAGAYILGSSIALLARRTTDPMWSDLLLKDSSVGRFSELVIHRQYLENYPLVRYGMDAQIYWPRLFLVAPADTKAALTEVKNSYLVSRAFCAVFVFWFEVTSPLVIGCFLYAASTCSVCRWIFFVAGALFIGYLLQKYFNVERSFLLKRINFFAASFLILKDRMTHWRFILLTLIGFITAQIWLALGNHCRHWSSITCSWISWNPGWERVITLSLESICVGLLAQSCRSWFLASGLTYGELSCTVFDLYRKDLAAALGLSISNDPSSDRALWKQHSRFLQEGLHVQSHRPTPEIFESKMQMKGRTILLLWRMLKADGKALSKLITRTGLEEMASESKEVGKSVMNTLSGFALLLIFEIARFAFTVGAISCLIPHSSLSAIFIFLWLVPLGLIIIPVIILAYASANIFNDSEPAEVIKNLRKIYSPLHVTLKSCKPAYRLYVDNFFVRQATSTLLTLTGLIFITYGASLTAALALSLVVLSVFLRIVNHFIDRIEGLIFREIIKLWYHRELPSSTI